MSKTREEKSEFRPRDRWLLFAFLLGPLGVLTFESVSYSLVPSACADSTKAILHAMTAAFVPLCLVAAAIGWIILRRGDVAGDALWQQRTRWVAIATIVLALSSAIVILSMEIPNVLLRSCD